MKADGVCLTGRQSCARLHRLRTDPAQNRNQSGRRLFWVTAGRGTGLDGRENGAAHKYGRLWASSESGGPRH